MIITIIIVVIISSIINIIITIIVIIIVTYSNYIHASVRSTVQYTQRGTLRVFMKN